MADGTRAWLRRAVTIPLNDFVAVLCIMDAIVFPVAVLYRGRYDTDDYRYGTGNSTGSDYRYRTGRVGNHGT